MSAGHPQVDDDNVGNLAVEVGPAGVCASVRTLHPGYFALVMATGIMSIAMHEHRVFGLSAALLWLTGIAYRVLVSVSATRIIFFGREFSRDLADPRRGFGMFTLSQPPTCSAPA